MAGREALRRPDCGSQPDLVEGDMGGIIRGGWPRRCFERLGSQEADRIAATRNQPLVNPDAHSVVWATPPKEQRAHSRMKARLPLAGVSERMNRSGEAGL